MKKLSISILILLFAPAIFACTNLIVTKGASADGSVYIAYTNDAEYIYHLYKQEAMNHQPGTFLEYRREDGTIGKIPQVPHTFGIIGFHMNEHQVSIGETTFTGRLELWNHKAYLQYWDLMKLALERSKTAREAIKVITDLVEEFDYASEGESFSIADKNEAWIMEMVGTGNGGKGAIWVARRIPDGMICAHANRAVISTFPMDDPDNCMYSKNVISFAIEKGYYNPKTDGEFRFNDVYCPATPADLRYCSTRVWSMFNRAAPSLKLSTDFHRGIKGAESYPLWIKPDKKLGTKDIFNLIRDHYEGTPFDMTQGFDAGPFNNPNRNRPLVWEVDSIQCSWERPISTFNSAFTFVAQSRSFLPDEIGGLIWFGVDDSYVTCYVPLYNCISEIPVSFKTGDIKKFSWKSAWWIFNFVANYANLRYSDMIKDIQFVQDSLESNFLNNQNQIEKQAEILLKKDKNSAVKFLTDYDVQNTEKVMTRWIELGEELITKYNDGYVKDEKGNPQTVNYPEAYRKEVLRNRKSVILPQWEKKEKLVSPTTY